MAPVLLPELPVDPDIPPEEEPMPELDPVEPAEPEDPVEPVEPAASSVFLPQPSSAKTALRASATIPADLSFDAYISVSFKDWTG
jgi:hypothetical protein